MSVMVFLIQIVQIKVIMIYVYLKLVCSFFWIV